MKRDTHIVLTGCNGQLGRALQQAFSAQHWRLTALDRHACDLAEAATLRACLAALQPDIILNAAAYTQVDLAETETETAHAVNAHAPGIIGEVAARLGALVVHYSTDYVFDGALARPYRETDAPNPLNVYGKSKLAGEHALRASGAHGLILRTSWVFGTQGENFIRAMLRLAAERETLSIVRDQFGAPTSTAFLAETTRQLLCRYRQAPEDFPHGLYHLTAAGRTNWHEYAGHVIAAARRAGMPLRLAADGLKAIPSRDFPRPAARPANSQLDCGLATKTFDITPPFWQEDVDQALAEILAS
ncbi:MAG: dTDP-4-dehydrorhamnose reductase [Zoogloeaceae bacterium]|jgi:dTDP-4-dehydrorhamnose reductase|nr:dTDP-4-dehydrorhamnose reductase [Zoogloeaceae bacterium]